MKVFQTQLNRAWAPGLICPRMAIVAKKKRERKTGGGKLSLS